MNEARGVMREMLFEQLFILTEKIANVGSLPVVAHTKVFWIDISSMIPSEKLIIEQPVPSVSMWRKCCANAVVSAE